MQERCQIWKRPAWHYLPCWRKAIFLQRRSEWSFLPFTQYTAVLQAGIMAAAGFSMQAMLPTASSSKPAQPIGALRAPINSSSNVHVAFSSSLSGQKLKSVQQTGRAQRAAALQVSAVRDGAVLDRKLRVAVIGGGPSGACTAETLAKGGIETYLIERKLDNCKVRR